VAQLNDCRRMGDTCSANVSFRFCTGADLVSQLTMRSFRLLLSVALTVGCGGTVVAEQPELIWKLARRHPSGCWLDCTISSVCDRPCNGCLKLLAGVLTQASTVFLLRDSPAFIQPLTGDSDLSRPSETVTLQVVLRSGVSAFPRKEKARRNRINSRLTIAVDSGHSTRYRHAMPLGMTQYQKGQ
jgi:hypothetical protein